MNDLDNQTLDKKSWAWYDLLGQAIGKAMFPTSYTGLLRADSGVVTVDSRELTSGTTQVTTSGTTIDFTGIPSWAKKITVMFNQVSGSGTSPFLIRLGTVSGFEATGYNGGIFIYTGGSAITAFSTGFIMQQQILAAGNLWSGNCTITLMDSSSYTWTETSVLSQSANGYVSTGSGSKALASALTQIRLTTVGGADTFDAGSINILYE